MDARSGEILWQDNADTQLHPASLTKMMTLYIAFQEIQSGRLSLDSTITVSKNAAAQPPSRLGLRAGQKIKLRYLIRAAAIKSANDAAAAIGDAISGSEAAFGKRMTKTARALGMRSSTFKNAHGLTASGHMSSARDMTVLGRHLFYDFPQHYGLFSRRTEDAGIAQVRNTNTRFLDAYEGADGIKTGYTVAAGYNLTASAKRGDKRVIATVMGGKSTAWRNSKMRELMDIGFDRSKRRVKENRPAAAPIEELIASNPVTISPAETKQVARTSPILASSPRPQARPGPARPAEAASLIAAAPAPAQEFPLDDDVAMAIALGVQDALAEANAEPPPAGTLDAQAFEMAAPTQIAEVTPEPAKPSLRPRARPEAVLAAAVAPPAAPKEEVPFQLVAKAAPEPVMEVVKVAAAPVEAPVAPPVPRPAAQKPAEVPFDIVEAVAPAQDVPFQVVTETPAQPAPSRRAPIYDSVQLAVAEAPVAAEQVVVSKSTSGGRQYSVNVGAYKSRYEAEKALLKTALAESATLNESLRKITEKGGKYRASFLGLSADQAELACRRLKARGFACETSGPA